MKFEFKKFENNPVFTPGKSESYDSVSVKEPCLLKEKEVYYCFYSAFNGKNWGIGLATSKDLHSWRREGLVLERGDGWESHSVYSADIVKVKNTYYMYYTGRDNSADTPYTQARWSIGLAFSNDLKNWTKFEKNPIISYSQLEPSWEGHFIFDPTVYYGENKFQMLYAGYNEKTWNIGLSFSENGMEWRQFEGNPVVAIHQDPSLSLGNH